jgi:hypothetical protein
MDEIIEKVANRKAAYLREGYSIAKLMNQNPHKTVAIGQEVFLPVLIGYHINKQMTESRIRIFKLLVNKLKL